MFFNPHIWQDGAHSTSLSPGHTKTIFTQQMVETISELLTIYVCNIYIYVQYISHFTFSRNYSPLFCAVASVLMGPMVTAQRKEESFIRVRHRFKCTSLKMIRLGKQLRRLGLGNNETPPKQDSFCMWRPIQFPQKVLDPSAETIAALCEQKARGPQNDLQQASAQTTKELAQMLKITSNGGNRTTALHTEGAKQIDVFGCDLF